YRGSMVPIIIDGRREGYAGFFVDLTKRRNYEDTLSVLNRVLRHDLRNDMTVVIGYIESAISKTDDIGIVNELRTAKKTADRLVEMGNRAREIENFLNNHLDSSHQSISVGEVLEDEVEKARESYPTAEFELRNGSNVNVLANSVLRDVFEVGIENAVEHNDDDNPKVEIWVEDDDEDTVVNIADNGKGIDDERKEQVFGREELDQLRHGQGMDLFFVDRVVENFGGEVWFEDNEPQGSVLRMRFRKADSD
ncbi:MAG: HAMP domain-containing sensor histidine kinase, partial [Halobacteria archaeon]|nr:HAMP domain-containing sensor histidine kinase [Halobacteria archaeon]